MNKPRIAMIGAGRWARKALLPEFSQISEIVYCVHGNNTETAAWLKEHYPDIQNVELSVALADTSIDAVVIATPIKTHFNLAKAALEAGKHVFLEKPGCENKEQLMQLTTIATQQGLGLQIGYEFLHDECFIFLKRSIDDPIISIHTTWEKWGSFEEGIILNLACHELSMTHTLMGTPSRTAQVLSKSGNRSYADIISIRVDYPENRHAMIHINRVSTEKKKVITVVTRHDIWRWDGKEIQRSSTIQGEGFKPVFTATSTSVANECAAFVVMISTKPELINTDVALNVHESMAALA